MYVAVCTDFLCSDLEHIFLEFVFLFNVQLLQLLWCSAHTSWLCIFEFLHILVNTRFDSNMMIPFFPIFAQINYQKQTNSATHIFIFCYDML